MSCKRTKYAHILIEKLILHMHKSEAPQSDFRSVKGSIKYQLSREFTTMASTTITQCSLLKPLGLAQAYTGIGRNSKAPFYTKGCYLFYVWTMVEMYKQLPEITIVAHVCLKITIVTSLQAQPSVKLALTKDLQQ